MTPFLKSISLTLLLSTLAVTEPASAFQEILGGPGGGPFTAVLCPQGQAVIGMKGKAGAVLNTIQLTCGHANGADGDNAYGLISSTDINPNPKDPHSAAFRGGGPTGAYCPNLSAGKSIQVSMSYYLRHWVVSQIKLMCGGKDGGSAPPAPTPFGFNSGKPAIDPKTKSNISSCPDHQLMDGLVGRNGDWIDAIGPHCVDISTLTNQ